MDELELKEASVTMYGRVHDLQWQHRRPLVAARFDIEGSWSILLLSMHGDWIHFLVVRSGELRCVRLLNNYLVMGPTTCKMRNALDQDIWEVDLILLIKSVV
jgi:hypothetical protein